MSALRPSRFQSILMVPTLMFAFFTNLVEIILHPLSIFTVSGVLQAPTDFVLSVLQMLAMLPVLMVIPLTLIISGRRRRLAVSRHSKLTNSGYLNLRLGVSWL